MKKVHTWRTRNDSFEQVWDELEGKLQLFPKLEAKTLFEYLQGQYPGKFQDGHSIRVSTKHSFSRLALEVLTATSSIQEALVLHKFDVF